jgi:putative ABC transport system ATP-binding protein
VATSTFLLEARGISRRVPGGDGWLLQDICLGVGAGERVALAGPSGAGKSLLLRALALLDPLDAGAVYWHGRPVADADVPACRRHVMYLQQRPALFEGDVEANLREPFTLKAYRGRHFDRPRVLGLLAELGRDESFLSRSHRDLSGGEAQIVALLRALQLGPDVLLLDEATAALDPAAVQAFEKLVAGWLAEAPAGRAAVWVSHDPAQAARVAQRAVFVRGGRIVAGD